MGSILGGIGGTPAWDVGHGPGLGYAGASNQNNNWDPFASGGGGMFNAGGGGDNFDFERSMMTGYEGGSQFPSGSNFDWNNPAMANAMWDLAG